MRASSIIGSGLVALALASGCDSDTIGSESGAGASLQVAGAQYFRGPPPATTDGPKVRTLESKNNRVPSGFRNGNLTGHVDLAARGIIIWKENDPGYWGLVAGVTDPFDPGSRVF